jgi:hypothetical protein
MFPLIELSRRRDVHPPSPIIQHQKGWEGQECPALTNMHGYSAAPGAIATPLVHRPGKEENLPNILVDGRSALFHASGTSTATSNFE